MRISTILTLLILFTLLVSSFFLLSEATPSIQVGDSAIALGVDRQTHLPLHRTQSFSVDDASVYSWLKLVDVTSPTHNVSWIWLTPQKHVYYNTSVIIPDPGKGRSWSEYYVWSSIDVRGYAPSQLTGFWTVEVLIDDAKVLVQSFSIKDDTPLSQPVYGFSWPSYNIEVNIHPGPSYARQAVINAMKQWNFSQTWFQGAYGLPSRPIYSLIVSDNPSAPIQIYFNETQTTEDWGYARYQYWYNSTGLFTRVTCSIPIILSLKDGRKLNEVAIENVARHELGHALGLDHVQRMGDLMNHICGNLYDLHYPTTLNLYTLYQLSDIHKVNATLKSYTLPTSIDYTTSPSFKAEAEQVIDLTGEWRGYFTLETQLLGDSVYAKGSIYLLIYSQIGDQIAGLISFDVDVLEPDSPEVLRWLSGHLSGPVRGKVSGWLVPGGTLTQVEMVVGFEELHLSGSYDGKTMELGYQEEGLKLKVILTRELGAEFEVNNLIINPTEVGVGEAVEISVTVTNVGKEAGECEVTLTINGIVEDVKTVWLLAGESKVVTFIVSKDVAGTYAVEVNGLTGSFRVKEEVVEAFDFSISVSPAEQSVVKGDSVSYIVTVSLISGKPKQVTLYPPKSDEQLAFKVDPPSGTPPFTSTLTVQTSDATKTGRWWFTIVAVGGGVRHETGKIYLTVEESAFKLSVFPTSQQEVKEGDTSGASWNFKIIWVAGEPKPVTLEVFKITTVGTAPGFPNYDIKERWLGNPTKGLAKEESAGLTLYADRLPEDVGHVYPVGEYEITIKATAGSVKPQYATISLKVLPCSSSWALALPAGKVGDYCLALGPIPKNASASWEPAVSCSSFKTDDEPSIVSWISFENIFPSKKEFNVPDHVVRWEWINPAGDLVQIGTQYIPTTPKRCQFWLKYNVFDELPSSRFSDSPGRWTVKVYFDDSLKLIQNFEVEAPFDFTISVNPPENTVVKGGSATYTITVTLVSGKGMLVTLVIPEDDDLRFSLNPASGIPPFTSTLTVYTHKDTEAGRWQFTLYGKGGGKTHETDKIYLTVKGAEEKKCIIATAAYGSELNPHVQFLREFRENVVLKTFAGSQFMNVFNAWYYSFSPNVAAFVSTQESVKTVARGLLYPLLGILHLGVIVDNTLSLIGEVGIVVTGLVVSALIGFVYFTPLTLIPLYAAKKLRKNVLKLSRLKILLLLWIISMVIILVGEAILSPILMMSGTGLLVLLTVTLTSLTASILALEAAYKISHRKQKNELVWDNVDDSEKTV